VRHFDSNYGQNLSIWDRMFGTLVPPEHPSRLRLGLSDGSEVVLNRSLWHMYWLPIRNAGRLLGRRFGRPDFARSTQAGTSQPHSGIGSIEAAGKVGAD
jgi:hypothetical protein